MMPSIGIYLLYVAVALRGALIFAEDQRLTLMLILFGAYGLLLLVEPWITRIKFPSFTKIADQTFFVGQMWRPLLYIILQTSIVMALMAIPETQDFFALLFVPLSLKAILIFGRRLGYVCITIFSILMIIPLLGSEDGPLFGFVMGVFFSGMCFLFGGYAHQVQRAEAARSQNQQIYNELRIAHRQLQLYTDQAATLAIEQERNRLARDLHDSVTQTVFSMNLTTQSARLLWTKEPATALEQLFHLEELAVNALSEIQTLVWQLRPRSSVEEGLPTALKRLTAERQTREDLHVSLQISEKDFLSEEEAGGLYSIAYEALTNIIKHSGTREATIRLSLDKGESFLEIEDHGCGFDPTEIMNQSGHLGLAGMSERAREIGWILSVSSRPQQGTQIRVTKNYPIGSE
jgi:signal transduction histidine kinase